MPPLVSVVMPVRDAAATVGRAIASIQAQTFTAWELVVVDDGSTDGTREMLARCAVVDSRIRVIEREPAGVVAALNAGVAAARGEFIARMDADDEAHPERLVEQVRFLQTAGNAHIGVSGCLVEFGGERAASEGYAQYVDWINSLVTPEQIALNRFIEAPLAHPSVLFRRELVDRFGGYRAGEFPEDYELWLRWMDAGVAMAKVPRVLLRWNDSLRRLSRTDPRYGPDAFYRLKAEWIARELVALGVSAPRTARGEGETLTRSATVGGAGETSANETTIGMIGERLTRSASIGGAGETLTRSATEGGSATPARREVWVWGAGRPTRKRAGYLQQHGVVIRGYIDVDPRKATAALGGTGRPVITPAELPAPGEVFVLGYVGKREARQFDRGLLQARGYVEGHDFLMCA